MEGKTFTDFTRSKVNLFTRSKVDHLLGATATASPRRD